MSKRVVLDHCVPRSLTSTINPHSASTAFRLGWSLFSNGKLLDAAEGAGYEVLVTIDRGFEHQQQLSGRTLGVLLIKSQSTTKRNLKAHSSKIAAAIERCTPGELLVLEF